MYENITHNLSFSEGLPGCLHWDSWTFNATASAPSRNWEVACKPAAGTGLLSFAPVGPLVCEDYNQTVNITTTGGGLSCNTPLLVHRNKPISECGLGGLVGHGRQSVSEGGLFVCSWWCPWVCSGAGGRPVFLATHASNCTG
jgi:hypothetical protein